MTEAEIDLNFLCACLREAGELALMQREPLFGGAEHEQMEVELKADRSPVTTVDRQVASLEAKITRLRAMVAEAEDRRAHLEAHLADIDAGREPTHEPHAAGTDPRESRR